jgi:hypothetical protein
MRKEALDKLKKEHAKFRAENVVLRSELAKAYKLHKEQCERLQCESDIRHQEQLASLRSELAKAKEKRCHCVECQEDDEKDSDLTRLRSELEVVNGDLILARREQSALMDRGNLDGELITRLRQENERLTLAVKTFTGEYATAVDVVSLRSQLSEAYEALLKLWELGMDDWVAQNSRLEIESIRKVVLIAQSEKER